MRELRKLLRQIVCHPELADNLSTDVALDHLVAFSSAQQCDRELASAVEKELPLLLVYLVEQASDVSHQDLLRLAPEGAGKPLMVALKRLSNLLEKLPASRRNTDGMRVARIMADIYAGLGDDSGFWRRRRPPPCCIDDDAIRLLKEKKKIPQLATAYETRVGQLQHADLRHCLDNSLDSDVSVRPWPIEDHQKLFTVEAPLRLGISSANASDNHLRTKEQGAKTLNASIDLQFEGETVFSSPLQVTARRLPDPVLSLRSRSQGFKADFEVGPRSDPAAGSSLFFAYRRGGDEALRLVKQALIQTGIVHPDSTDVLADVVAFTGGGGLEVVTRSKVLQGSGLGTSSILAAAILKVLFRLTGRPEGTDAGEYPSLYDQSLLLEQSVGLNSGWQDARGAFGGPSAVKNFAAAATEGLPAPTCEFIAEVDPADFTERVVLFDTGISRAASRGLNVLLDAYLCRDAKSFDAMKQSFIVHDQMVAALRAGNYGELGRCANAYWRLRCRLDPGATSEAIQLLLQSPEVSRFSEGGMLTGAGGGGFALLVAREGAREDLRSTLNQLRTRSSFANSRVVDYRLNSAGIRLYE